MKLPIPDDWPPGQEWVCVEVQWPSSTTWIAILNGWLSQMARGRTWDEDSGSILAAMQIGKEIWSRNAPLTSCGAGTAPPAPSPDQELVYGGAWFGEDDDEMGCNPCLRWNEGVLEVLECGQWVAVPGGGPAAAIETPDGGDVGDPEIPQPGDDTEVDVDVKCRAAYAIAHAMWRVHARIVDYVDDVLPILNIGNLVSNDLPEYTLQNYHLSLAAASVVAASALVDLDIVFVSEEEYVADMANWFKKFMPTRYSLSRLEYEALALGLLAYSFHEGIEVNLGQLVEGDYWRQIFWALGPGTVNDIMAQSRTMDSSEFDCHERQVPVIEPSTPPLDGGPWWSGLVEKTDLDGTITAIGLSPNMRKITIRWDIAAPGVASTDLEALIGLVCPANLTSLTLVLTGDYPLADWHSLPYDRWDNPHIPLLAGVVNDDPVAGFQGSNGSVWVIGFDSGKPTAYEAGFGNSFRFLPQSTEDQGGSCTWSIEIAAWA